MVIRVAIIVDFRVVKNVLTKLCGTNRGKVLFCGLFLARELIYMHQLVCKWI